MPLFLVEGLKRRLGGSLRDRKVAVLGLTFKRDTDDARDSLSYKLIRLLERELAHVSRHDPYVPAESEPLESALSGADAVVIATNHSAYDGVLPQIPRSALLVDPWNVTGYAQVFAYADELGVRLLMRVLITGVGGFVGKHLAEQCAEQGAEVLGVGRSPLSGTPFAYEQLDLLDAGAVRELVARSAPERVFHLAALASVAHSWGTPIDVVQSNVTSTLNLLEAVRVEAPETLLLASSSGEEYGAAEPAALPVRRGPCACVPRTRTPSARRWPTCWRASTPTPTACASCAPGPSTTPGPGQADTYVVASFARQIAEAEAARAGRTVERR